MIRINIRILKCNHIHAVENLGLSNKEQSYFDNVHTVKLDLVTLWNPVIYHLKYLKSMRAYFVNFTVRRNW